MDDDANRTSETAGRFVNQDRRCAEQANDKLREIAEDVARGRQKPSGVRESTIQKHLYVSDAPDVDLFLRSSGEQRTSNFLLWQSAYAEMVFLPTLWPDMTRLQLWEAIEEYQRRQRRFGGAVDAPKAPSALPGR